MFYTAAQIISYSSEIFTEIGQHFTKTGQVLVVFLKREVFL